MDLFKLSPAKIWMRFRYYFNGFEFYGLWWIQVFVESFDFISYFRSFLKMVGADYGIVVATNMKGAMVLHWGESKLSPGEWLVSWLFPDLVRDCFRKLNIISIRRIWWLLSMWTVTSTVGLCHWLSGLSTRDLAWKIKAAWWSMSDLFYWHVDWKWILPG